MSGLQLMTGLWIDTCLKAVRSYFINGYAVWRQTFLTKFHFRVVCLYSSEHAHIAENNGFLANLLSRSVPGSPANARDCVHVIIQAITNKPDNAHIYPPLECSRRVQEYSSKSFSKMYKYIHGK